MLERAKVKQHQKWEEPSTGGLLSDPRRQHQERREGLSENALDGRSS
jgi:hypothetical protein